MPKTKTRVRISAALLSGMVLTALAVLLAPLAVAQKADTTADDLNVEEIADGLVDPIAVVVRPGGSRSGPDLLVVESPTGRVLGLSTAKPDAEPVEVLPSVSADGTEKVGPALFRSRNRLLLGSTAADHSSASIVEFDIDDEKLPMKPSDRTVLFTYKPESGQVKLASMARDVDSLIVATNDHQWLLTGKLKSGPAEALTKYIDTLSMTKVGTPQAVAYNDKGYVVVAETGKDNDKGDSMLVFYHPSDSTTKPLLALPFNLDGIRALAYSPTTGCLYAAAAEALTERSGIFRIDSAIDPDTKQQSCNTVLITETALPTAMAFAEDGTLYVTVVDMEESQDASGKLLKLTGGL
ncbi:hypothetical protein [Aeoliella sp. SH292]|uniref:hypothetical protein n=1 Tax=Aeoliella sp. SH292 TaxID=3454464 RepID=UPI003F96F19A